MAGEKQLSDGRTDGVKLGQNSTEPVTIKGTIQCATAASELVGFWGHTPVAQPVLTYINTATATTSLNEQQINRIIAALVSCGIIRTT